MGYRFRIVIKNDLLYMWQLFQHIFAYIYYLYCGSKVLNIVIDKDINYVILSRGYNVTLGKYIFMRIDDCVELKRHLIGHYLQSKLLGPLYIPIIIIPAALWLSIRKLLFPKVDKRWFYTERWADMYYKFRYGDMIK